MWREFTLVTIKEIASLAGVSVKTVTRAYKKDAEISKETREKILALAKKYGYRPNLAASRLSSKPILIGVCHSGSTKVFTDEFVLGISDAYKQLENSRVTVITRRIEFSVEEDNYLSVLDEFEKLGVSGIITSFSFISKKIIDKYYELKKKKIILVMLNNICHNPNPFDLSVTSNINMTGKMALELISFFNPNGNNIVFTGESSNIRHIDIVNSYKKAALETNVDICGIYDLDALPCDLFSIFADIQKKAGKIDSIYITTGNSESVLTALRSFDPDNRINVIASDILPHTAEALRQGRINAIIYQNPSKQARISLLKLYSIIAEGVSISPSIEISPSIVIRSNLESYMHNRDE